jgi:hypothetical protein
MRLSAFNAFGLSNPFDLCPALRHFSHLFGPAYLKVQLQNQRFEF